MTDEGIPSVTDLPKTSPEIAANYSRSAVQEGDIVMSIGPSFGKVAMAQAEHTGANLTQGTARIAIAEEHLARYFFWLLRSSDVHQYWTSIATGATFPALNLEPLGSTVVPIPSYKEQQKIAAYLDHTTALIDQLLVKNTALLELLDQQRKAIINEAVTKGLDPKVPMKESGIGWLGKVPKHWSICKLKRLVSMKSGDFISASSIGDDGPYLVYGGNGVRGTAESYTHDGDFVLIGRQGALCGNINYANGKFWATEHAVVVTPVQPMDTQYLGELLRAMNLNQYSESAAQPGLSVTKISNLDVPNVPYDEQVRIGAFLQERTELFERAKAGVVAVMEKLKEYRQSIISEAVTGKVDLREWEPAKQQAIRS
ncbi:MAG: restriction endonuclease subunit S [Flavobacteriales bacterium]|nr:restriction endonuclease subunit S [Flavobacteriales bacterium]